MYEGRLLVFPNCHAHCVMPLTNNSDKILKRRIVVGFLVNPNVQIPSASSVPNMSSSIIKQQAIKNRKALMNERKFYKQSINQRNIDLCEH
jgi:hypothetical protein